MGSSATPPSSLNTMPKKRVQEHIASPKFHRVAWTGKRTRRGAVLAAEVITPGSPATPVKLKKYTTLQNTGYSQDQTPILGEGIKAAMSLPPIPAPEILAPKKGQAGKV